MEKHPWWVGPLALALVACGGSSSPPGHGGYGDSLSGESHWPLSAGSRWKYRINDETHGIFEKEVEVLGEQKIPGTATEAIVVKSVQPHLEETSWQLEKDGLVYRALEEDRKDGVLVRSTTWQPATVKNLASAQEAGWTHSAQVRETVKGPDGIVLEDRDKSFVWRVLATNISITTPAGTFITIKVQRDRPDKTGKERTYWLAPGVGKVREEGERDEDLMEYEVK